jgi:hypothetical protein
MEVRYGDSPSKFGPGVIIEMTGNEVARAVDTWLVAHGIHTSGPRTVTINSALCDEGQVYVDPSGFVIADGIKFSGRGPEKE